MQGSLSCCNRRPASQTADNQVIILLLNPISLYVPRETSEQDWRSPQHGRWLIMSNAFQDYLSGMFVSRKLRWFTDRLSLIALSSCLFDVPRETLLLLLLDVSFHVPYLLCSSVLTPSIGNQIILLCPIASGWMFHVKHQNNIRLSADCRCRQWVSTPSLICQPLCGIRYCNSVKSVNPDCPDFMSVRCSTWNVIIDGGFQTSNLLLMPGCWSMFTMKRFTEMSIWLRPMFHVKHLESFTDVFTQMFNMKRRLKQRKVRIQGFILDHQFTVNLSWSDGSCDVPRETLEQIPEFLRLMFHVKHKLNTIRAALVYAASK